MGNLRMNLLFTSFPHNTAQKSYHGRMWYLFHAVQKNFSHSSGEESPSGRSMPAHARLARHLQIRSSASLADASFIFRCCCVPKVSTLVTVRWNLFPAPYVIHLPITSRSLLLVILVLGRQESKAWLILSQILTGVEVLCKVVLHAKFSQLPVSRDDRYCCLSVDVMSCGFWAPYQITLEVPSIYFRGLCLFGVIQPL